jgi:mRNA interferase MazF
LAAQLHEVAQQLEPRARYPLTLEVKSAKLPKRSWVKISQIRKLAVDRLGKRLGRLSDGELRLIVEGLNEVLGAESE